MATAVEGRTYYNNVETEAKEIEALLSAAKNGEWKQVWAILGSPSSPRKGYLINVIPQSRRWGVLHQAVFLKDPDIVRRLLKFNTCDWDMKTKKCSSSSGETGRMNALDIAHYYGYTVMCGILAYHVMNVDNTQVLPTFLPYDGYCDNEGQGLISVTLAAYKQAFHPAPVDPNKTVLTLLHDIFNDICRGESRWKQIREVVADSVYVISSDVADSIRGCANIDAFFVRIVNQWTDEDNALYSFLNMAFRRQRDHNYSPSADNLAMGPYCVMYQMLLLYWNALERESKTTYRKMKVTPHDADMYKTGTKFVWQSIVASALFSANTNVFPTQAHSGATSIIFTIDNSTSCVWQPRNIEPWAFFSETERTYPAGAKFLVTDRKVVNEEVQVKLRLLAK